jgi:poly(ADP-ribose) glycohydrolase ARH3
MRERFEGCLLGLALGDALGAPYESGPVERLLWRLIGRTRQGHMRWTDDTQMSVDVAESLLATSTLDADDLTHRFASSYRWSRGYGPGAARLLKRIARGADWREANRSVYPDGSFGNGGAMRAPIIGLFYAGRLEDLNAAARLSARITHAHPLGLEGAVLMAFATAWALRGSKPLEIMENSASHCELQAFTTRLEIAIQWLRAGNEPPAREVARQLGHGIAVGESCVTALYAALRFMDRSFLEMQAFVIGCRGDVDTIGAMAGAIWGAAKGLGSLPSGPLSKLEQREKLMVLAAALHARKL